MGIHERELHSGHRLRQGRPLSPGNGDSNPPHPWPRVWRLGILGALTRSAAICLVQGLGHPGIRDPQWSQGCRIGVTHCKHGGNGVGDKFCPPIRGEVVMVSLKSGVRSLRSGVLRVSADGKGGRALENRTTPSTQSIGAGLIRSTPSIAVSEAFLAFAASECSGAESERSQAFGVGVKVNLTRRR
jgi:hypothetical protein